jgi:hypothetical protein
VRRSTDLLVFGAHIAVTRRLGPGKRTNLKSKPRKLAGLLAACSAGLEPAFSKHC